MTIILQSMEMLLIIWLLLPVIIRLRKMVIEQYSVHPNQFSFPEGCRPNIKDATTFESMEGVNETELSLLVENMVIYTLNESEPMKWEEYIRFEHPIE